MKYLRMKAAGPFFFLILVLSGCVGVERQVASTVGPDKAMEARALSHYARGRLAEQADDYQKAADEFYRALTYDKNSTYIGQALLANALRAAGSEEKIDAVADAYQGKEDVSLLLQLGEAYLKAGNSEKALRSYELAGRLAPEMMEPIFYLGYVRYQRGEYGKAVTHYRHAIRVCSEGKALVYYYLALALERMELYEQAIGNLLSALKLDPVDQDSLYHLAVNYEQQGELERAAETYRKLLVLRPQEARIRQRLVEIYYQERKWPQAIAELGGLIQFAPENLALRVQRGQAYYLSGDYIRAIEDFAYVVEKDPIDTEARFRLGVALETSGRTAEAESVYQLLLGQGGPKAEVLVSLARVYSKLEKEQEMIAALEEAVVLAGEDIEIRLFLAHGYFLAEQIEKAADVYRSITELDADNVDARFNLGIIYDRLGEGEKAVVEFRQVLRIDPANADAYNYIGYTYAEKGIHLDEAIQLIEKALRLDPDNGYYLDSLGWAYYRKGRLKKAEQELLRAVSSIKGVGNEDAIVYEHLGDVYHGRGKEEKALIEWKRALELAPANEVLKKKITGKETELKSHAD